MPKLIEYPKGSLARSVELAGAVDAMGGSCTPEMCATRLDRKTGGAFKSLTGAAVKYGLIEVKKQELSTTELFAEYKLAYSDADREQALRQALLLPPTFQKLYERFSGKELPVKILDKLLIREFGVAQADASKVGSYFVDGAKSTGMLGENNILNGAAANDESDDESDGAEDEDRAFEDEAIPPTGDKYTVSIRGPGMRSEIQLLEPDDLLIVDAMLKKVRNKLEAIAEEGI